MKCDRAKKANKKHLVISINVSLQPAKESVDWLETYM